MEITRSGERYISPIQSGSFLFNNIQVSSFGYVSGSWVDQSLVMGFATKDEERWVFTFENGKIYDPEGRFFAAFNEEDIFSISGNFTTGTYDYYLNDTIVCSVGRKSLQTYNHWFVECANDETINVDPHIASDTITGRLLMKSGFFSGEVWSGNFYNDYSLPVTIRSGEIFLHDAVEFSVTNWGEELVLNGGFDDEEQWDDAFGPCVETLPGSYTFRSDGTLAVYSVDLRPNTDTLLVSGPCYLYGSFDVVNFAGSQWGNSMILLPNGLVGTQPFQPTVWCLETGRKFFQCYVEPGASFTPSFFFASDGDGFIIDNFSLHTGLVHGMAFNNGANVVEGLGCRTIRLAHTGVQDKTGLYTVGVRLFTDYGKQEFVVSGYSVSKYRGVLTNSYTQPIYADVAAAPFNLGTNANFSLASTYVRTDGTNIDRDYYVGLEYISGATGTFIPVTGGFVDGGGAGYTTEAMVFLSIANYSFPVASGRGLVGGGQITGVILDQTGYYTTGVGAAQFTVVGDGAGALVLPMTGISYSKIFSGNLSLLTGVFGAPGSLCARSFVIESGFGTMTGLDSILDISVRYIATSDNAWIKYRLTTSGMPDPVGGALPIFFSTGVASRT